MSESRSNFLTVGRITGAYGIKGWVKVKSFTQPEKGILDYQPWCVKTRFGIKSVEIAESKLTGKGLIARFVGAEDRNAAEDFVRSDIAVEKAALPELDDQDFYWHQLIGLTVVSVAEGLGVNLGEVENLLETGANDVLVVRPTKASIDDRERLLPFVMGLYVKDVDLESSRVLVDWDPEF